MHPAEGMERPSLNSCTAPETNADDSALLEEYLREELWQVLENNGT